MTEITRKGGTQTINVKKPEIQLYLLAVRAEWLRNQPKTFLNSYTGPK